MHCEHESLESFRIIFGIIYFILVMRKGFQSDASNILILTRHASHVVTAISAHSICIVILYDSARYFCGPSFGYSNMNNAVNEVTMHGTFRRPIPSIYLIRFRWKSSETFTSILQHKFFSSPTQMPGQHINFMLSLSTFIINMRCHMPLISNCSGYISFLLGNVQDHVAWPRMVCLS